MNNTPFTIAQMRPIREAMTISRPARLGAEVPVTWFSMGAGTSICGMMACAVITFLRNFSVSSA